MNTPPSPLTVACRQCGAEVNQGCRPLEGDHPRAIGYHGARYIDAGWPIAEEDA